MPQSALIILDFDRTIFDNRFGAELIELLAQQDLISQEFAAKTIASLSDTKLTLDMLSHLELEGIDIDEVVHLARTHMHTDDFFYSDLPDFLAKHSGHKIIILTSGSKRWQNLKIELCPPLEPYTKIIIGGNKGEYLKDRIQNSEKGVTFQDLKGEWFSEIDLIDDRINALEPLVNTTGIVLWHLQRPDSKYTDDKHYTGIKRITSLKEAHIS